MGLREVGWVEWIHLAQDRDRLRSVVNAVMDLRFFVPRNSQPTCYVGFKTNYDLRVPFYPSYTRTKPQTVIQNDNTLDVRSGASDMFLLNVAYFLDSKAPSTV
jgi:hypothetical protein